MANRIFRKDLSPAALGIVTEAGQIVLSPAAGVGTTSDSLLFSSASMVSAGKYRVQFEDSSLTLLASHFSLENTGSVPLRVVRSGSAYNSTGLYVDFLLQRSSGSYAVSGTFTLSGSSAGGLVTAAVVSQSYAVTETQTSVLTAPSNPVTVDVSFTLQSA